MKLFCFFFLTTHTQGLRHQRPNHGKIFVGSMVQLYTIGCRHCSGRLVFIRAQESLVWMAFSISKNFNWEMVISPLAKLFSPLSPNDVIPLYIFWLIEMCFGLICLDIFSLNMMVWVRRVGQWDRDHLNILFESIHIVIWPNLCFLSFWEGSSENDEYWCWLPITKMRNPNCY